MEKMKLTKDMQNTEIPHDELNFNRMTYKECEEFAEELASRTVIITPENVVYRAYNFDMMARVLFIKHYWNYDIEELDNEEGRYLLADFANRNHYAEFHVSPQMDQILSIYYLLFQAMKEKTEKTSSLSYKIGKLLDSLIVDENLTKTLAESDEVTAYLLGLLNKAKSGEKKETEPQENLSMFGQKKKD